MTPEKRQYYINSKIITLINTLLPLDLMYNKYFIKK